MDTNIQVGGGPRQGISSFTVREDSTPLNAGDNSGGTGSISVGFADFDGAARMALKSITLRDRAHGIVGGRVSSVGGDEFEAELTAETRLIAMVDQVVADPYIGTLGGALTYYLGLVGLPDDINIDPVLAAKPVAYIGWSGMLYDKIKELAILHRMEISLVSNYITIRPVRGRIAESANRAEFSWNVDATSLYSTFSVAQYNLRAITVPELVYPSSEGSRSAISMDAREEVEVTLRTDVSLIDIEQPQITQALPENYEGNQSLYAVIDKDGKSIDATTWANMGGWVRAEINPEDRSEVILTARGGSDEARAPFRLALPRSGTDRSAGEYPALTIAGTGVAFMREVYEIGTGVPTSLSLGRKGPTVDTIFAANRGDAWQLASSAGIAYSAPQRTVNARVEYINRQGESGVATGATYDDFENEYPVEDYADFEVEKGVETYEQFADDYLNRTIDTFDNQAFGNAAGSRVRFGDMYVRIRSATITERDISYVADEDTTIAEFQEAWGGDETYADFAAHWGDADYNEFGAAPLWH